jgi:uncharacterized protein (DUF362 family)
MPPVDSHWKSGFPFARPCLEAEMLVQTCCLKTHRYDGQLPIAEELRQYGAKNILANYIFMNELHNSRHQRRMIAGINTAYTLPGRPGRRQVFISGGQ